MVWITDNMIKELVERFKQLLGQESFQLQGHMKVFIDRGDGEELYFEKKNLIVTSGKVIVLRSIFPSSSSDALSYAKVGEGGATDVGGLFLKTPTIGMTDLYTPVTSCSISSLSINTVTLSRVILAVLDNSQANGHYINEVGFFAGTGEMFNIKTFPRILKTSSFSINFQWTISVL